MSSTMDTVTKGVEHVENLMRGDERLKQGYTMANALYAWARMEFGDFEQEFTMDQQDVLVLCIVAAQVCEVNHGEEPGAQAW